MKKTTYYSLLALIGLSTFNISAQVTERTRPASWDNLIPGARFMDRFMPMQGSILSDDTWGAEYVRPRYVDNGIEDRIWSYWGGNITKGDDGKYHLIVCGWLESSPKGHMQWPKSTVFNTVSDNLSGPYSLRDEIGAGHNPEVYRMADGRYVLYVIDGRYVADSLNGPWEYGKFEFDTRDRSIVEGLSNLSFAQREDGSMIMVDRGGGIWVSRDGLSPYHLIIQGSIYPKVEGRFEDPVIWKDSVQYNMIVNDWYGRIAYYLRSANGVDWIVDDGEAYMPGIAVHPDGRKEDWFKYERLKIYQDEKGRAVQANFAVIDTLKHEDKPRDNHSSKNISIPLNPGLIMNVLETPRDVYEVEITNTPGFSAASDLDIESLIFGFPHDTDYGNGCKATAIRPSAEGAIVTFQAKAYKPSYDDFVYKLIGRDKSGNIVYGYARQLRLFPDKSILSARAPKIGIDERTINIEVENFGTGDSDKCKIMILTATGAKEKIIAQGDIAPLKPYESANLSLPVKTPIAVGDSVNVLVKKGKNIVSKFLTVIK